MLPRPTARRVLGIVAAVAAVGISFTAGVVAGAGSREPADTAAGTATGTALLDDAASEIAGSGLRTVDRETLDAAAIAGMLRAAGDPWGSWADATGSAGIGVWLRMVEGRVAVARVATGSPAGRGGPTVARISVPAFTRGVGRQVRTAVAAAAGARSSGVVLDLRGNPGGLLDEA